MRRLIIHDRTADGGYPLDSDLHQMSDDGCPLVPDPARWADVEWRDNLGVWDTFDGPAVPVGIARLPSLTTGIRRSRLLRCNECGRTEGRSPEELLLLYATSGWPECCGRLMNYSGLPQTAGPVPSHVAAA
jgi:hypothetical protein